MTTSPTKTALTRPISLILLSVATAPQIILDSNGARGDFLGAQTLQIPLGPPFSKGEALSFLVNVFLGQDTSECHEICSFLPCLEQAPHERRAAL